MKHSLLLVLLVLLSGYAPASVYSQTDRSQVPPTAKAITKPSDCSFEEPQPRTEIKLALTVDGWGDAKDNSYPEGKEIRIRCVFTNISKVNQEILLDDHHDYFGTLDFPRGLHVRLGDSTGRVLTEHEAYCGGWRTSDCHSSNLAFYVSSLDIQPGDIITLKPGEMVTRIASIKCFGTPKLENLGVGDYKLRLRLWNIYSDELKIKVKSTQKDRVPTPDE